MICFIIIALGFGLVLSAPVEEDLPILGVVGGHIADQHAFNYQVSLQYLGRHKCGGTLYSTNIVITAAHCTLGVPPNWFTVRLGTNIRGSGGKVIQVENVVSHPNFNFDALRSDVAIIKLAQHVQLGPNIGTVSLTDLEPSANIVGKVSGWGHTKESGKLSNELRYADVTILDRNYCRTQNTAVPFTQEMICAGRKEGGVDACQADSGGPLVNRGKLIGIVSWGLGCARPGKPGVYTNVAFLKNWIHQTIQRLGN